MKSLFTGGFLLAIFFGGLNLRADTTVTFGNFTLKYPGEYRFLAGTLTSMDVEAVNPDVVDKINEESFAEHRLLFMPQISGSFGEGFIRKITLVSEFQLMSGSIAGDFAGRGLLEFSDDARNKKDGFSADNIELNSLYLALVAPPFTLRSGRQRSHWGLGMLANHGWEEQYTFGYKRGGDIVDRATLSFMPLYLSDSIQKKEAVHLSFGADRVVKDALADIDKEDSAYNILATLTVHTEVLEGGLYYLYRIQENFLRDETTANVIDAFIKLKKVEDTLTWGVEFELALATGKTELMRDIYKPETVDLTSLGYVLRCYLKNPFGALIFEAGYASGDSNPYDDSFNMFSFNKNYTVGLIMFREYLKAVTAVTAYNISDPQYSFEPARGYKNVPSNGSVQNAVYAFPRLQIKVADELQFLFGLLVARSEEPLIDPFITAISGGDRKGHRGAEASHKIGYEFDAGIYSDWDFGFIKLKGAIEYGYFKPGQAFDSINGYRAAPVHLVQGRVHFNW